MSPQKFVKKPPAGWTEIPVENGSIGILFSRIQSTPDGFQIVNDDLYEHRVRRKFYRPEHKIAVRLPDGRLVIPTTRGERSQ